MNGLADLLSRVPAAERETVAGVVAVTPLARNTGADSGFDVAVHRTMASKRARRWLIAVTHHMSKAPAPTEQLHAVRHLLHTQPVGRTIGDRDALAESLVEALLEKALDRWAAAARHDAVADFLLVDPPAHVAKPKVLSAHSMGSLVVHQAKWIESASLVKALDQARTRPPSYSFVIWEWSRHLADVTETDPDEAEEGPSVLEDMHAPLTAEEARAVSRWFHSPLATPRKLPPRP